MQKKLMAVAVAGALAVPAAAFAAASSVQISGRLTYEYGYSSQGDNRPSADISGAPGGSNIRFKGTENLGGGLSAWFQCETSTDVRALNTNLHFCSRNSAIGLKGAFGNIHFGKWDTPMKRALNAGTVGAEGTGMLGMSFIAFGGSGGSQAINTPGRGLDQSSNRHRWKRRESSLNYYESPKFSGFQVLAAYSPGNAATNVTNNAPNSKPRVISFAAVYDNGPLEFGLGYEKHEEFGRHQTGATTNLDDDAWGLGITYSFGKVEVGAFYLDATYETGPIGAIANTESDKQTYGIGVNWRLPGPHMVSAQYVKADDTGGNGGSIGGNGGVTGCNSGGVINCADTGGDAWTFGYTYRFSKRTTVKLGYTRYDNDSRTRVYRIGNIGSLGTNGESSSAYAMLWKHNY
jgi:predicted porin